jgi:hypothetical protein
MLAGFIAASACGDGAQLARFWLRYFTFFNAELQRMKAFRLTAPISSDFKLECRSASSTTVAACLSAAHYGLRPMVYYMCTVNWDRALR